jgi:hypothetical protein
MAADSHDNNTLMPGQPGRAPAEASLGWTLPPDLLAEAVRRLRVVALVYAASYFIAGPLLSLLVPEARTIYLATP